MSSERPLSSEEQRQRLKEQYKRELLEHRQRMRSLKNARRIKEIERILEQLEAGPVSNADDVLAKLQQQNAELEARIDLGLAKHSTILSTTESVQPDLTRTLGDAELIPPRPTDDVLSMPRPTKTLGDAEV